MRNHGKSLQALVRLNYVASVIIDEKEQFIDYAFEHIYPSVNRSKWERPRFSLHTTTESAARLRTR